jgi:DNA mismatch repair protein MutL
MSDIIHLLPDVVANQIAAGEVVQRPSSVIKELLENSIDASASRVEVNLEEAGKNLIQVIDNGKGMSETDARLAFERHATSKIKDAADLYALTTMGFRGEALASIAAVAQVELKTRRPDDEIGTMVRISGDKIECQEPVACSIGANFSVRNLFFNVPARRRFLKSNQVELSNILTEFERVALVNPSVAFKLSNNGGELFNLPASGVRQRILNIFGKKVNDKLLPLDVDTSIIEIHGFVGSPEAAKKKGANQYFFVNGRYTKHPYFHKAVMEAYNRLIPVGEQIPYFIYLTVDADSIDVNIHPTKTEIKFENEQAIWQILMASVRECLGKFSAVPTIDFDSEVQLDIPVFVPNTDGEVPQEPTVSSTINSFDGNPFASSEVPASSYTPTSGNSSSNFSPSRGRSYGGRTSGINEGYNPFASSEGTDGYAPSDWSEAYTNFEPEVVPGEGISQAMNPLNLDFGDIVPESTSENSSPLHICSAPFQVQERFIVAAMERGILIVDQHRAHLKVLYEQYMQQIASGVGHGQMLMFPEIVEISPSDQALLEESLPILQSLGFEINNLGGGSFSVSALPSGVDDIPVEHLIRSILTDLRDSGTDLLEKFKEILSLSLAKNGAIVGGMLLNQKEMSGLLENLFTLPAPNFSPEGKLVYTVLETDEILRILK